MKNFYALLICTAAIIFFSGCWGNTDEASDLNKTAAGNAVPTKMPDDPAKKWRNLDLKKYPDANTILLDDIEFVSYNSDGTESRSDESWTLIVTKNGKEDARSMAFYYNEFYQKIPSVDIRIIKPDGKVVKPLLQTKITTEASQMQSNIYDPANKILSVAIPGLDVGDIVYCKTVRNSFRPRMKNIWCDSTVLQYNLPILHYKYVVSAPENTPLAKIAVKDEVKGTLKRSEEKVNGRIIYTFEAENVPQFIPEPDMPPFYLHCMRVLVSTVPDWQSISRWYYNLCEPRLKAVSPEMIAKTREVTAGKKGKAAIRALFDFVSKEIRYTGVTNENTAPGYEPHDVKDTFAQKHGVCRDKAALLAAMLLEAGFDAFPVLFMAGDPKDPEVPNNYFNHAITGVKMPDGELVLMDATDENSVDMLPAYAMDKSFLCATRNGDILRKTSVIPAEKNLLTIKSHGVIDKELNLHWSAELNFDGFNDAVYRSAFAEWSHSRTEQFIDRVIKRVLPGFELKSYRILPENVRDLSQTLQLQITGSVKGFADIKWGSGMLNIPYISGSFGGLNFFISDKLLKKRKYPMRFESTVGTLEECSIVLPENLQVAALPVFKNLRNKSLEADFSVKSQGKQITVRRLVKLNATEIPASGYDAFHKAVQNITFSEKRGAVVSRKFAGDSSAFAGAHAVMLDKSTHVTFSSRSDYTATVKCRMQILNYGGVKKYSELSLDYVEGVNKSEFISAAVTAPDGKVQQVDLKGVQLMDDAVSAGVPRYPAAKKLILPLPGVEVGSIIEYSYSRSGSCKDLADTSLVCELAGWMPIKNSLVSFSYPVKLAKYFKLLLPEAGFQIEERVNNRIKTVTVRAQDIPMFKHESAVPPFALFAPVAGISNFDTADYAAQMLKAFKKAADNAPECAALASVLTKKYPDLRERVKAIRDHVSKNIRSGGLDFDVLGNQHITAADKTLLEGYGNSIDRAVLLYALLKAAKIDNVTVVLASDMPDLEFIRKKFLEFPQDYFNAVLLRVSLGNEEFYLNDTGEYAELGSCAHEGMLGLDLSNGELVTIESAAGSASEIRKEYLVRCLPDNAAEITITSYFYGMEHAGMKGFFDRITPQNERQFWEQSLAGNLAGADFIEIKKDFTQYPGMISCKLKHPDFWQTSGEYVSFVLPGGSSGFFNVAGNRTLPYLNRKTIRSSQIIEVELLKNWRDCLSGAKPFELAIPGCNSVVSRQSSMIGDNTLKVTEKIEIPPFYLDGASCILLENLQKELANPANRTILFKTTGK